MSILHKSQVIIGHGGNTREGFDAHTLCAKRVSATLENLFHGDARADEVCTRLLYESFKPDESRTGGEKIVHDEYVFARVEVFLGEYDGVGVAVGEKTTSAE